jgi:hypothetical protein
VGLFKYVKKAFANRWNLLLFLGGMGFAALSNQPDVAVPLVLAGEAAYLGFIGTHPKFQRYVDSQEHAAAKEVETSQAVGRLLEALPREDVERFLALRERCLNLRRIAEDLQASQGVSTIRSLDDLQLSDLDRLLWIYLRMLYTRHVMNEFLERTDERAITAEIRRLEQRLASVPGDPTSPATERIQAALKESLETTQARLANLRKARENYEVLQVEIGNLEAKIQSISELAVNRHDPGYIAGQVDAIAAGLVRTEQTMNELQVATGLEPLETTVPSILAGGALPRAEGRGRRGKQVSPPLPDSFDDEAPRRGRDRQNEDGIRYY